MRREAIGVSIDEALKPSSRLVGLALRDKEATRGIYIEM